MLSKYPNHTVPEQVGSLQVGSVHSFRYCQLLFLNQWKRKNGHRIIFMTKSSRKNTLEVDLKSACIPSNLPTALHLNSSNAPTTDFCSKIKLV